MQQINESRAPYQQSPLWDTIQKRTANGLPIAALFTDLDETFYLEGHGETTQKIFDLCKKHDWLVAIATGNGFAGTLPRIMNQQFPSPDIVIGSVGTDIWILTSPNHYTQDQTYQEKLRQSGFDRLRIAHQSEALVRMLQEKQPDADFVFQRPEAEKAFMNREKADVEPYKVSFYFNAKDLAAIETMRSLLQTTFPDFIIAISDHTTYNRTHPNKITKRYCADILPISKSGAIHYLTELLHITSGVVAGDSGNDVDMLLDTNSTLLSVLVGGAKTEAIAAIQNHVGSGKTCYDDSTSSRLGPESILHVMQHQITL